VPPPAVLSSHSRIAALGYEYGARSFERVDVCNLCGSRHHVEVTRRDRYYYPAVCRVCVQCGLGFLSPRLTAAEYKRFYEGVYRPLLSAYYDRLIDAETIQAAQREYASELVAFLESLDCPPQTVLDLGGSTGIVAAAVRDAFQAVATVVDPSPAELEVAEAAGLEVAEGLAESFDAGGRRWDLVLLCQTVDHLLDVGATLESVRGLLTTAGRAFVDVVDFEFAARRKGSVEAAVKIDHPYYLSRWTARAYFERTGLDVVAERMSDDGHWGFLVAPSEPREPDWEALRQQADRMLETFWRLRAG
jgi:SAM-dependent methyltransferase